MSSVLNWLLEKDDPSVRCFTLRHLLDQPEEDHQVRAARRAIMESAPVRIILAAQEPGGYWVKPGAGYSPKYRSTVWQILFLAELGASGQHPQVKKACGYLFDHAQAPHGGFSFNGSPSRALHCLNGNLVWALTALGLGRDERVRRAAEWLAGAITGDGFTSWYASGVPGPGFRCVANAGQPCAWGAVKSLRALANVSPGMRSARFGKAVSMTVDFLTSRDLAAADYPFTERVSGEWFKFGFPLSYTSDVLEALLALAEAGHSRNPRLKNAIALVSSKRDSSGRWILKHSLNGNMWADIEVKGQPSKWITLRALRVLKSAGEVAC